MAAQLNYNYSTPAGVPGGKFDISFDEVATRSNEEEDGVLKYGLAVFEGTTAGKQIKLPTADATAATFEGVVIALPNTEQDMEGMVTIKKNRALSIMRHGHIWGRLAKDATPTYGATAYVVLSGDDAGCFTAESTGTLDIGAKFGNATDDGIAVIEL